MGPVHSQFGVTCQRDRKEASQVDEQQNGQWKFEFGDAWKKRYQNHKRSLSIIHGSVTVGRLANARTKLERYATSGSTQKSGSPVGRWSSWS